MSNYPVRLQNLCKSFGEGPSQRAKQYLANCHNMRLCGRVRRFVPEKMRNADDPYFAEYIREIYGKAPSKLFHNYRLAQPNAAAGYMSLKKYDKIQPTIRKDFWDLTLTWAEKHFGAMRDSDIWEDHEDVVAEINKVASAGYPWTQFDGMKSKKDFFEWGGSKDHCLKYWMDLREEVCRAVPWTNNVKEELRKIDKIIKNLLRTFVGAPVEVVYAGTKLFGDQNEKFYNSAGEHWSFVGATKFRLGWNKLFKRLNKHPNAFELDESEYDSSLFREAMLGMAEFRFRMLKPKFQTPENWNRIQNLYKEIVDTVIITTDGDVVTKNTGNPSGSPNTIVDNTVILFRLKAYAWLLLMEENEEETSYEEFMDEVEAALTGDDNTFTVSDKAVSIYNATNIARVWTGIGVTTKTDSYAPRKLEECSFLSTSFRKVKNLVVPMPEGDKVMCSMAFHNNQPDNVRWSLLRACALRIESFFDDECRALLQSYITWLTRKYYTELHAPRDVNNPNDMFTFNEVYSVYKTDSELRQLFLAEEGQSPVPDFNFEMYEIGLQIVTLV